MLAACSRASLAGVAAAKEIETKTRVVKGVDFIVREPVDRQTASEIPKHPVLLARLFRRGRSKGFHEVPVRAQCLERRRLPLSRCRAFPASLLRKCPIEHCA